MERMGQDIPQTALLIKNKKANIKQSYGILNVSIPHGDVSWQKYSITILYFTSSITLLHTLL